jgi:hypothetical protein
MHITTQGYAARNLVIPDANLKCMVTWHLSIPQFADGLPPTTPDKSGQIVASTISAL